MCWSGRPDRACEIYPLPGQIDAAERDVGAVMSEPRTTADPAGPVAGAARGPIPDTGDRGVEAFGYQQELKRSLSFTDLLLRQLAGGPGRHLATAVRDGPRPPAPSLPGPCAPHPARSGQRDAARRGRVAGTGPL